MHTPMKIVVTIRPVAVVGRNRAARKLKKAVADGQLSESSPTATARVSHRFAAEWVGGPHHGQYVEGYLTPDEAVGALIRDAAECYETYDELLQFISALFDAHPRRNWLVQLARAVRLANRNPMRMHPGCPVILPDAAPITAPAAENGGAA